MPSLPLSSSTGRRRFPLLVVPDHKNILHSSQRTEEELEDDSITTNRRRSLYCLLLKQPLQFQIELPSQFDKTHRFCGSSHGWLITSIVDDHDILHISLFNPFSPNSSSTNPNPNVIINLPPIIENLVELPYARENYKHCNKTLNLYHNHYVAKAVLSCDPSSNPDEYVIMVIYSAYARLAFIRPGTDATWTYLDRNIYEKPIADVIYYKGKVFAVDCFGMVVCCEADDINWRMRMVSNLQTILSPTDKKYLVESVDGELLLVQRSFDYRDEPEPLNSAAEATVTEFKVFKMMKDIDDDDSDCDNSNCCDQWMEMKSIGDCALFVGDNGSTSVRASDIGGCSSNSIYFTADGYEYTHPKCDPFGYTDMGVFHLEDKTIESIDYTTTAMSSQTPIWITAVKEELN